MSPKPRPRADDDALVGRRRRQLTLAAIACFSARGYHSTTIRDVAERAEVSVGLVYQYVEDKEDLLFMALQEVLDAYRRRIPAALEGLSDPLERFHACVRSYCEVNDEASDATVLAYRETKSLRPDRREIIKRLELETNAMIDACIRDCIAAGVFTAVDIEMFTHQLVMFCHGWALKAWRLRERMTVADYVARGLRLMLEPVLAPPAPTASERPRRRSSAR